MNATKCGTKKKDTQSQQIIKHIDYKYLNRYCLYMNVVVKKSTKAYNNLTICYRLEMQIFSC